MLVYECMVPKDQVVTCNPTDTIESVIDKFLDNKISAVIVLSEDEAAGIITKTDIAKAYKKGYPLEKTAASIMNTDLKTTNRGLAHDQAAAVFMKHKIHHAVVTDDEGKFVGVLSAWDVAREGYLDAKAWPWNRNVLKA
jgi:CBS domain-containing protein